MFGLFPPNSGAEGSADVVISITSTVAAVLRSYAVDKTYLYAFLTKTNYFNDDDIDRTWLRVYNYETMEEIINLTPVGYEYELMKCMDISEDGRQLAVLNEGKAYLKVWNTETFDLTKDKRYTLSETTTNILAKIDNQILIKVYLEGDFPSEFKRLQVETQQYLEELAAENSNIKIHFIIR